MTLFVTIIYTQGIQMTTRKKLCAIKGISEAKVDKIKVSSKPSLYAHCITSLLTCYTQEAAGKLIVSENYFQTIQHCTCSDLQQACILVTLHCIGGIVLVLCRIQDS